MRASVLGWRNIWTRIERASKNSFITTSHTSVRCRQISSCQLLSPRCAQVGVRCSSVRILRSSCGRPLHKTAVSYTFPTHGGGLIFDWRIHLMRRAKSYVVQKCGARNGAHTFCAGLKRLQSQIHVPKWLTCFQTWENGKSIEILTSLPRISWFSAQNRLTTSHTDNSTFIDAKRKWSNASNAAIRGEITAVAKDSAQN